MSSLLLLAQGNQLEPYPVWLRWLLVWADPQYTEVGLLGGLVGGFMTWAKLVGLFCLVAWLLGRFVRFFARPDRGANGSGRTRANGPLLGLLAFLVISLLVAVLIVAEQSGRITLPQVGRLTVPGLLLLINLGLAILGLELAIWTTAQSGTRTRDTLIGIAVHLAVVLGIYVIFASFSHVRRVQGITSPLGEAEWVRILVEGVRYGATYAGLVVLAAYSFELLGELGKMRWRRLYAIAWQTVVDAVRRTWAPWVVLVLFVVFLAFTHWFLGGARKAELARLFVEALTIVCSFLLTFMIFFLAPLSLPNDISTQTIYTVVTKPVRRIELLWGRLLGYGALVTVVLAVIGGLSLVYLNRVVGTQVQQLRDQAQARRAEDRLAEAKELTDQADQLETRMSARVPVYGFLSFTDSRGAPKKTGINVGMEMQERSHIEGATASRATWRFGMPLEGQNRPVLEENMVPVSSLLKPGSIEALEDRLYLIRFEQTRAQSALRSGSLRPDEVREINARLAELDGQLKRADADLRPKLDQDRDLLTRARAAASKGDRTEAARLLSERRALRSDDVTVEMNFNVFRTTKGELGKAVLASLTVTNPLRPDMPPERRTFPVHEYYTIRQTFPARVLVGSMGRLVLDVQCISATQFIGMAEKDLFILSREGNFAANYVSGLVGTWLQVMVMTAVGLLAGTFLSWRVALLFTFAAWLAGQLAIGTLDQFSREGIVGGGPFESLIRLLGHESLQSELAPTPGVIAARSLDLFLTPILTRLVYVVPNIAALDLSETVSQGFAVTARLLVGHILLGLGYIFPLTGLAYFILKKREVAA